MDRNILCSRPLKEVPRALPNTLIIDFSAPPKGGAFFFINAGFDRLKKLVTMISNKSSLQMISAIKQPIITGTELCGSESFFLPSFLFLLYQPSHWFGLDIPIPALWQTV